MAKVAQLHDNIDKTRYYVLQRENVIGRSEEASIRFDNKVISRRHIRVAQTPSGAYFAEDISARGVYVNFHRIQGRHPLMEGDRICILHYRNVHPVDIERMTPDDLKACCDDRRNEGVKAVLDVTFGTAEVKDTPVQEVHEEPKGFLAKLKSLFGKG